jgi:hypothetical protein
MLTTVSTADLFFWETDFAKRTYSLAETFEELTPNIT